MATLEDLTPGTAVRGIVPDGVVTVSGAAWVGSQCIELTYKDSQGRLGNQLVYRDQEPSLEVVSAGRLRAFDGDGKMLRLVSEAQRISLAHLFDPLMAVHTSLVDPLPHQISAVYGEMLSRQPLRYLLADDPGAGKTIMAGLLIKELILRGDVQRALICCPGALAEQWQDEMRQRFGLSFTIITREMIEASSTGNPYLEHNLVISRLDHMSRNDDVQARLRQTDWDLVICDEAHKMSASFFNGEVRETKRYKLGKLLGSLCRHLLLMTATPHNGKEAEFQLFMALLDADRFEGKFRDGVHQVDTSDLMRRMVKEKLVTFENTPLFPERLATTVQYTLSPAEAALYHAVTEYVRDEMNRADRVGLEGDKRRGNTVGFALTILQRRLASSPEAIYQSLRRRRLRLESRLRDEQMQRRGADADIPWLSDDDLDDLDDAPESEVHALEEQIADAATAARTNAELAAEIQTVRALEEMALRVRQASTDRKWEELSHLLQDVPQMFASGGDANAPLPGRRHKLIIFTEHRDTLTYLHDRLTTLLGRREAVALVHGGMGREERRTAQERFTQDKETIVLIATDAAGEGFNLQRAHLMVNYDLPWNPNRLEQRFGRIHRIGQTEVCHLWNLVAQETREGDVFLRLFEKLEEERKALGGQVFDVLGKVFGDTPLRALLIEAIRYGDQPEVRARLNQVVADALDHTSLLALLDDHALARDSLSATQVAGIRQEMERAEARRLQPHYIAGFFLEAFRQLGGTLSKREAGRYEISHVPSAIRQRDRQIGQGSAVLARYERVTFSKEAITLAGAPVAAFLCPGHPLFDSTLDLTLERHRDLLVRGAVLIDRQDGGSAPRLLSYLEHSLQDARTDASGKRLIASRRLQFVESDAQGSCRDGGAAPYLDYEPPTPAELALCAPLLDAPWLRGNPERAVLSFAADHLVPAHLRDVRDRRTNLVRRTRAAVQERLTKEIAYWDHRSLHLKDQEEAGKTPRLNSGQARRRADDLQERLRKRLADLIQAEQIIPLPPVLIGGALVIPQGALDQLAARAAADPSAPPSLGPRQTARVERAAMDAVMQTERDLGFTPRDVGALKLGYDIESSHPDGGSLRFIEVKGRIAGADTVTVTRNEILTALNRPDAFILAIVEVFAAPDDAADDDASAPPTAPPRYVRRPFRREPEFGVTAVTYKMASLLAMADQTPQA